jgi:hypothetical protein
LRDTGISRVEALPKRYGPTSVCDTGNLYKWHRTHFKILKAGFERYSKLYLTKKSDTPLVTNWYVKAIRDIVPLR